MILRSLKRFTTCSGAGILVKQLKNNDCNNIFLYNGGTNLSLLNEIKNQKMNYIMNINEQCSGHNAVIYTKSSNNIGVVVSTSGLGLTNLITPLLDAKNDGIPLIVITSQFPTTALGTNAFQEAPSIELMQHCIKKSTQIKHIKDIEYLIDEAYYITKDGKPGPVHLDCPKDILAEIIDKDILNNISTKFAKPIYKNKIKYEVVNLMNISKKPDIIGKQGSDNWSDNLKWLINNFKTIDSDNYPIWINLGISIFNCGTLWILLVVIYTR